MEAADQLHNLWIGCAKDSLASVFCDIIEYHPMFRGSESWDEALAQLCTLLHDYCDRSGLEKAVIDEISLTKLSIKSITYDFPAAFSKGWANRVGTAFASSECWQGICRACVSESTLKPPTPNPRNATPDRPVLST